MLLLIVSCFSLQLFVMTEAIEMMTARQLETIYSNKKFVTGKFAAVRRERDTSRKVKDESHDVYFARKTNEHFNDLRRYGMPGAWLLTMKKNCLIFVKHHGLKRLHAEFIAVEFFGTIADVEALDEKCALDTATPIANEFKIDDGVFAEDMQELTIELAGEAQIQDILVSELGFDYYFDQDSLNRRLRIIPTTTNTKNQDKLRRLAHTLATHQNVTRCGGSPYSTTLNYEARWIVQSDNAILESTPLYNRDGLLGENVIVGCADSGLDYQSCFFYDETVAVNFDANALFESATHRKIRQYVGHADTQEGETSGHGSHVVGSINGHAEGQAIDNIQGVPDYINDGMSPLSKVAFYDIGRPNEQFLRVPAAIDDTIFTDAYSVGARIHSNSWGANVNAYLANDQSVDSFSWENQDFLVLIAAGNSGPTASTLGSPATSKNGIAVGATENVQSTFTGVDDDGEDGANIDLASFSSRGPAFDGRIKPDLVAPGDSVISANSLANPTADHCTAARLSGTSMATPVMAGTASLLYQYFTEGFYPTGVRTAASTNEPIGSAPGDNNEVACVQETCFGATCDFWNGFGFSCTTLEGVYGCDCADSCCGGTPTSTATTGDAFVPMGAALKALLVASARYLPGTEANRQGATFPNQDQGFGLIVVDNAINPTETTLFVDGKFEDMPVITSATNGEAIEYEFEMAQDGELRVVLVWHDPPSVVGTDQALINDLDLLVTRKSDGAVAFPNGGNARDTINNVERIIVGAATQGEIYTAKVSASAIGTGPQPFSLVATGPFLRSESLYPDHVPAVNTVSRGGADAALLTIEGNSFNVGGGNSSTNWVELEAICDDDGSALSAAQVITATSRVIHLDLGAQAASCDSVSVRLIDDHRWYIQADTVSKPNDQGVSAVESCYHIADITACNEATALCQTSEALGSDLGSFVNCEPSSAEQERLSLGVPEVTVGVSNSKKKNSNGPGTSLIIAAIVIPIILAIVIGTILYFTCQRAAEKNRPDNSLYRASTRRVPRITSDAINSAPLPPGKPPRSSARLPSNWEMFYDDSTGNVYYFNKEDKTSQWDPPKDMV